MRQDNDIVNCIEELAASDRSSTVLVCIQGEMDDRIYGEIYSYHLNGPVMFMDIGDLILKIDEICSWLGAPLRTSTPRFMNREMERRYRRSRKKMPEITTERLLDLNMRIPYTQLDKVKEVLVVYVKYRQDFSMQGSVKGRLTEGKTINFRSALELMRMMRMIRL